MSSFVITGATGSVGNAIVKELLAGGHEVRILSTRPHYKREGCAVFHWNPAKGEMDLAALEGVEYLIHLAGATVSKRWTPEYKQEINRSRVEGTQLLIDSLDQVSEGPKMCVSASAIGIYGSVPDQLLYEDAPKADDFLATVTQEWERYTQKFETPHRRSVQLRIGIVLDRGAGVLGQLEPLAKWGLASPLGSGKQWTSWIHVEDLARLFVHACLHQWPSGVHNAVAPNPVTNRAFTKALCATLGRPMWLPAVPAAVLKAVLGQMATLALMSQKVAARDLEKQGFSFRYTKVEDALAALYKR